VKLQHDKKKLAEWRVDYVETTRGRALKLINNARKRSKLKNIEIDLPVEWLEEKLINNECEITKLPFDLSKPDKHTRRYNAPSLDRIDKTKGYTPDNTRLVLWLVNCALSEYGSDTVLPVLKKMITGIENAQENTSAPVSAGDYIQGAVGAELGSVSTPWTWEDDDQPHHHCGTIPRQDTDHRAKAGSGDGMGHGGTEVGAPKTLESFKDYWQPRKKTRRIVG
jgi:hypothetical protein